MRKKFCTVAAALLAGNFSASTVSAHPGHASTDVAAQLAQPFAGLDHFAAFAAVAVVLLTVLRLALNARKERCARVPRGNAP